MLDETRLTKEHRDRAATEFDTYSEGIVTSGEIPEAALKFRDSLSASSKAWETVVQMRISAKAMQLTNPAGDMCALFECLHFGYLLAKVQAECEELERMAIT